MAPTSSARATAAGISLWLLLLASCSAPRREAEPPAARLEVKGLWVIAQARTEPIVDRRRARLEFGSDGSLAGHTSCNPLSARYSLVGVQLKVEAINAAGARCRGLLAEQEDRILTALEAATTARVRPDGLLELRDEDGRGVLRATRFDPENPP